MSVRRHLFLDASPGEMRGVVTLDGKPERLLIHRDAEVDYLPPGTVLSARVSKIERGLGIAFLRAPSGEQLVCSRAALPEGTSEGGVLSVQITAPARSDKSANAKVLGPDAAPLRIIGEAPPLKQQLQAFSPHQEIETGPEARDMADEAMAAVFETEFPLPGGASISIESTRALIAVDVDVGQAAGQDARFSATKVNQMALSEAARLARLKGLGGLMCVDLAGKGHNGPVLLETAKGAFGPDQPGVALGAISRFGILELVIPWRHKPLIERLADPDGRPSALTEGLTLLRAIEREAGPGRRVEALCSPAVSQAVESALKSLTGRIGPRFTITPEIHRTNANWTAVAR
jgi:hypothetical protein